MSKARKFRVEVEFYIEVEDVLDYLDCEDDDYEPTDDEWFECARKMFNDDECDCWYNGVEEA